MRKVLEIKECMKTFEGDGIPVTRAFPVPTLRELDPFLLFDHFGPIHYEPGGATGVPAHPHCGFEAITYLLGGEVEHKDSWGRSSFHRNRRHSMDDNRFRTYSFRVSY